MHMPHNKVQEHREWHAILKEEKAETWNCPGFPRWPIRPAFRGHKPSPHRLRTLERKPGYGRRGTSLDAFWTPRCTLCFGSAMGHSFPARILPQHPETLGNGHCFGAQQPPNFLIKKTEWFSWKQIPIVLTPSTQWHQRNTSTSTLQGVQNMCGWSCQKGSMSRPEIFIVDQSHQFFTKLDLNCNDILTHFAFIWSRMFF